MEHMREHLRVVAWRSLKEQRGFTLVEGLVTASLMTVILAAVLSLGETSQKLAPRDEERAFTLRDAQVGLSGMTRELRQSYTLNSYTATSMDVLVRTGGASRRVVYDCNQTHPTQPTMKRCSRWEIVGGNPTTKVPVVPLVSAASFTYEPAGTTPPWYVRMKLDIPAKGDRSNGYKHKVVLDDGFYMRNLDD